MFIKNFRCQKYNPIPVGCVMRRSRIDTCCLVPDCRHDTVVNDNQRIATSRILSEIRQPTKTGKLTLIKMFNQRMETRKNIHSDQLLGPSGIQNIPITSKAVELDRRKLQTDGEAITFEKANTGEHSTSSSKQSNIKDKRTDNRIPDKTRIMSDFKGVVSNEAKFAENVQLKQDFRSLNNQKTPLELVTPYIKNQSHLSRNTVNTVGHEGNAIDRQLFRTIKTEIGMYKAKIKDGTISAYKNPISVGLSRMLGAIAAGKSFTEQSKNTSGKLENNAIKAYSFCKTYCTSVYHLVLPCTTSRLSPCVSCYLQG